MIFVESIFVIRVFKEILQQFKFMLHIFLHILYKIYGNDFRDEVDLKLFDFVFCEFVSLVSLKN